MHHEEYGAVVQEAWDEGERCDTAVHTAISKLASCQTGLKCWSRKRFGNAESELKKVEKTTCISTECANVKQFSRNKKLARGDKFYIGARGFAVEAEG